MPAVLGGLAHTARLCGVRYRGEFNGTWGFENVAISAPMAHRIFCDHGFDYRLHVERVRERRNEHAVVGGGTNGPDRIARRGGSITPKLSTAHG
jgi:hypothetical protein